MIECCCGRNSDVPAVSFCAFSPDIEALFSLIFQNMALVSAFFRTFAAELIEGEQDGGRLGPKSK